MNGLNAIVLNGKVYEAVPDKSCDSCDFDKDVTTCQLYCDACNYMDCAFRFSQSLTDKLIKNEHQTNLRHDRSQGY